MATISTVDGDADAEGYEHADAQDCIWYASAKSDKIRAKSATARLSWTVQNASPARQDGSRPDASDAGRHAYACELNGVQAKPVAVYSLTDAHATTQGRSSLAQRLGGCHGACRSRRLEDSSEIERNARTV